MIRHLLRALALALVLLAPLGGTPAMAEPAWTMPPPDYRYAPAPCPETGAPARFYRPCEDQMALLGAALDEARREGRLLIVKLGANWCPNCRALHPLLLGSGPGNLLRPEEPLGKTYRVVEIATSMLSAGRVRPVPSGEAVLAQLTAHMPGFKLRAIPLLAFVDPTREGKVFLRHVDDLVKRGEAGPDSRRLAGLLIAAEQHLRHSAPAPGEPGWLSRKWNRLLSLLGG